MDENTIVDENIDLTADEMAAEAETENEAVTAEVVEDETPEVVTEEVPDKASEYLERLQRTMAEFDNYRKRSEKEKEGRYDLGVSSTIAELLPIVDNFERALSQETEDKQFAEGVAMIHKQFITLFEKLGVTPLDAKGKPFDPELHSAIMQIQDETLGENTVAQEHQKGYMYKEKVIRHSLVTVAN